MRKAALRPCTGAAGVLAVLTGCRGLRPGASACKSSARPTGCSAGSLGLGRYVTSPIRLGNAILSAWWLKFDEHDSIRMSALNRRNVPKRSGASATGKIGPLLNHQAAVVGGRSRCGMRLDRQGHRQRRHASRPRRGRFNAVEEGLHRMVGSRRPAGMHQGERLGVAVQSAAPDHDVSATTSI